MFDFHRLDVCAKEAKRSNSYLCSLVNRGNNYISDLRRQGRTPPTETVAIWADALGTTPAYLMGETDQKEKPTGNVADGLTAEMRELLTLFDAASPEIRAAALAVLKSGGPAAVAPGAASSDQ